MSFEGNPNQFNKEKFKSEIRFALEKYFKVFEDVEALYDSDVNINAYEEEKKRLDLDKARGINNIALLSAQALKLSDNKQEILDILYESLHDLNLKKGLAYDNEETLSEPHLLVEIILELLKDR